MATYIWYKYGTDIIHLNCHGKIKKGVIQTDVENIANKYQRLQFNYYIFWLQFNYII